MNCICRRLSLIFTLLWSSPILSVEIDFDCLSLFNKLDYHMSWGTQLLREGDPAFCTNEYCSHLKMAASPGIVSYNSVGPYKSKYNAFYEQFLALFSDGTDEIHHFAPLRFTNSGTEANNALYELAEISFERRTGKKATRANLLYFGQPYGGTFGRIAEIGSRYTTDSEIVTNFHVPTPFIKSFHPSELEVESIRSIEQEALDFIRRQTAKDELQIGGIFIEPIAAFSGIFTYRRNFLGKLRELADELGIPIFADEILTGGGRTGKFLASNHFFPDFEPDVFTFGKGLVVSGLAKVSRRVERGGYLVDRWDWPEWNQFKTENSSQYPDLLLDNTSRISPLVLAQSIAVLKRIRHDNLIENAETNGKYLLDRLRRQAESQNLDSSDITGFGLLIYAGLNSDRLTTAAVRGYSNRWTPPLSLSKSEIDKVVKPSIN